MGILNKMQSKQKILLVGMVLIFFSACYYDKKDQVYPQVIVTTCDTTNVTYSTTVTGILNANCISCHGSSANSLGGGIVLNTYATLKPYVTNGNLVNSILQLNLFCKIVVKIQLLLVGYGLFSIKWGYQTMIAFQF